MTKIKAFSTHLIISLLVVACVFLVIRFQIYPGFYYSIQGISEIILILFAVDVIMGPLLTLIVFKPGKKSLKFDLSVIAMFQIAALAYGSYTIYQERPLSALLVNNSFEIQTASSYNLEEVDPEIVDVDFLSSPKFHVLVPTPEIKIAMMVHAITGEGETDYIQDTKLYSGIIDQKQRISEAALTSVYLDKIYSDLKADVDNYLYVRVIGKSGFGLVQIDKSNFEVIDVVELTDFDMQAL